MENTGRHWLIASLVGCLTIALFLFDVHTPLGIANHVLYFSSVLLAFLSPMRAFPFVVAALCSVLTAASTFMSANPYNLPLWIPISNRFFSLFVIWVPVFYFHQRRRHEEALQKLNEELEQRVRFRTKQLESVNNSLVDEVSERMRTERLLETNRRELKSLTMQLLRVQEQERRRIARDLHDDINQRLAVMIVELDQLTQQKPSPPERLGLAVRITQERLVELSEEVRTLAYQLHPSILDDLGLPVALQRLAQDFEARTDIRCHLDVRGGCAGLDQDAATCLYRVAQESLANVARHAKASSVELLLERTGHRQTLTIADDGIGFDHAPVTAERSGLGLLSIKERVALADGWLDIATAPRKGTKITVAVPVDSEGQ